MKKEKRNSDQLLLLLHASSFRGEILDETKDTFYMLRII